VLAEMLKHLETELDFLNRVITGDKSWFFRYDPETKRQSEEWHTPHTSKTEESLHKKSKIRTIVDFFFPQFSWDSL
jgi:hypothetical protein